MFFFLSKTLNYLLMPTVLISASFLLSWIIKNPRWKKRFFFSGLCLLLFLSNEFIMNEVALLWEVKVTPFDRITKKYEYGIVLSGAARSNVEVRDRVYIRSAADRINHTLQLYKLGLIRKILVSGGSGRLLDVGEREADELASLLRLMGVPDSAIITEPRSRNTHESAVEVAKMLKNSVPADQCLLITSATHMRRSEACFARVGWKPDTFSADVIGHPREYTFDVLFIPKVEAISGWHTMLKEWMGYVAYWLAGYV